MKFKFWGCRGSIPVPDSRMMRYGGNTPCVEFDLSGKILVVDAGTGVKKLGEDLARRGIENIAMFITHTHWDHIQGFPFFAHVYSSRNKINIFGCTGSYNKLKNIFQNQMSYEYFPLSLSDLRANINFVNICDNRFEINGYVIRTIQLNHTAYTLGIRIDGGGRSTVFMTDNELHAKSVKTVPADFVGFCKGADYLIHDAQFLDSEYGKRTGWGHSTYEQAVELAACSDIKNLVFFHHDPNREDDSLDKIEAEMKKLCRKKKYTMNVFVARESDKIEI